MGLRKQKDQGGGVAAQPKPQRKKKAKVIVIAVLVLPVAVVIAVRLFSSGKGGGQPASTYTEDTVQRQMCIRDRLKAMDCECCDLNRYVNLFGFNPKYGVQGKRIGSVTYLPQPYSLMKKLYE